MVENTQKVLRKKNQPTSSVTLWGSSSSSKARPPQSVPKALRESFVQKALSRVLNGKHASTN